MGVHSAHRLRVAATVTAGVMAVAIWLLFAAGATPPPRVAMPSTAVSFDAVQALRETGALAQRYPDRVVGTAPSRRAAAYLDERFARLGYSTTFVPFTMWRHGSRVQGEDVVAYLPGSSSRSIAILAHYDAATTTHEAAEDDASGVGVELALARSLRATHLRDGLVFVATDAEEWGMLGARAVVPVLHSRGVKAAIVVDYVNAGASTGLRLDCTGQFDGFSPMWLRSLVHDAAVAEGVGVIEQPMGIVEWMYRSVELSLQDQGPLLDAGIPAVDLETIPADVAATRKRYHTPDDAFAHFGSDATSFEKIGATVERSVYALDAVAPPAAVGDGDFLENGDAVIQAPWILAGQALAVALCLLVAFLGLRRGVRGDVRSWLGPALWSVPLIAAALTLRALAWANILPRYESYPATTKDPFLTTLPIEAIVPALIVFIVAVLVVVRLRPREASTSRFDAEKAAVVAWLGVTLIAGFFVNRYGALAFVAPVFVAAALTAAPVSASRRLSNAALLLAGSLPFVTIVWFFAGELYLGWYILLYLALQAAYGTWSFLVVVLFSLTVSSWFLLMAAREPRVSTQPTR